MIGMRPATEPPPTLADLIHRLETVRLAALLHGDYAAANYAASAKALLERFFEITAPSRALSSLCRTAGADRRRWETAKPTA